MAVAAAAKGCAVSLWAEGSAVKRVDSVWDWFRKGVMGLEGDCT